jgi:hypothetical protein
MKEKVVVYGAVIWMLSTALLTLGLRMVLGEFPWQTRPDLNLPLCTLGLTAWGAMVWIWMKQERPA